MICAVAGNKGGAGKTVTSVHLAGESVARGRKTLLADADPQRSSLTWADLAAEGKRASPTPIGVSTGLHRSLPPLAETHDLTVIDCPPRGDAITRAALMVADVVVIPTGPAPTDFWALDATLALIREAQELRPDLRAVLLLNRLQPRQSLSHGARDALTGLGFPVLKTSLGLRTAFAESMALGMTVSNHSPKTPAAEEIRNLLDELETIGGKRAQAPRRARTAKSARLRRS